MYFASLLFLAQLVIGGRFTLTCEGINILNNYILNATCLDDSGVPVVNNLNLNNCIGNDNGNLVVCFHFLGFNEVLLIVVWNFSGRRSKITLVLCNRDKINICSGNYSASCSDCGYWPPTTSMGCTCTFNGNPTSIYDLPVGNINLGMLLWF